MVMSEYVMFNEPGWECEMNTPEGEKKNRGYCNLVKIANIKYAMIGHTAHHSERRGRRSSIRKAS